MLGQLRAHQEQLAGLINNVKILAAGLKVYGLVWEGVGAMDLQVEAALIAAARLSSELPGTSESS